MSEELRDPGTLPQSEPSRIPRVAPRQPPWIRCPFRWWWTQAITEFLNGALTGWPSGGVVGGGTGTAVFTFDKSTARDWMLIGLVSVVSAALTMGAQGMRRFAIFHQRIPMPNPVFGHHDKHPDL